ncbi:carboxymuconolactone decarboxylase family protein [Halomonas sp. YLB-10]|uniref:carboxymuconolactone decarboxylase family protein n=1 Tax=unclassified Halomonas TaxID=2609666 RepID=UPI000F5E1C73|nr:MULTISPECIES: carboxymuconolactone decarboxylase family protein [unclassified Halomonas]RQW73109.1 carboxymuconolactone decarboxylase family protein [Halomonas sp. YLB-10]
MKLASASLLTLAMSTAAALPALADDPAPSSDVPGTEEIAAVSPALAAYQEDLVLGEVWAREGLSPRDRSVATLAAVIARNHRVEMRAQVERALDNGVDPAVISETITHLAFYTGWGNAMSAVAIVQDVFAERGIGEDQLPDADPELLPLDEEAEQAREASVEATYGGSSDGVLQYTTDVLFRDLWLRPALSPRDRSLVTVSALIAAGKIEQVGFHLNRAMDNGLTRGEASELLTQLAFYAGWPNVFSTLPVAKEIFESRAE